MLRKLPLLLGISLFAGAGSLNAQVKPITMTSQTK